MPKTLLLTHTLHILTTIFHCREDANILSCIPASNIFIEAGIEAGGVLVHCFGGRSRSAAFVAAYLMSSRSWGFDQALAVISAVRPVASVNRGFERQLRAYAQTGYDVYAAQQVLLRNRIRALHEVRGSWRSPAAQSFRKHRSAGKHTSSSNNGNSSSRNADSKSYLSNDDRAVGINRTDSNSSNHAYDAKESHGIGLGCDSFSFSNGIFTSAIFSSILSIYSTITLMLASHLPSPIIFLVRYGHGRTCSSGTIVVIGEFQGPEALQIPTSLLQRHQWWWWRWF